MNWRIEGLDGDVEVELAEGEKAEPDKALVAAARRSAKSVAAKLDGEVHVEVQGHETTTGRGFRPRHVAITVSQLDPKR